MADRADKLLRWAAVAAVGLVIAAACEPLWADVADAAAGADASAAAATAAAPQAR